MSKNLIQKYKSKNKEEEPPPSNYVPALCVRELNADNFCSYLNEKTAALVMFYSPDSGTCMQARPHFQKAAMRINKEEVMRNPGFGTVNCAIEGALCELESVRKMPTFNLYVNGRFVNRYDALPNWQAMKKFMENAPPSLPPRRGPDEPTPPCGGKINANKKHKS